MKFVHTGDSHLGFHITRVAQSDPDGRGRRAEAIYRNFLSTIRYALDVEADLFIHSGDLFNKYYIPAETLYELVRPLNELTSAGIRVLIIPGNHERSMFPFDLFLGQPNLFVFDRPECFCFRIDGYAVGVAGFPFIRSHSKRLFFEALHETEYWGLKTDLNILVTHQAFDQAVVGPNGFTFRGGRSDTVCREQVPTDLDYVAAGHIHRYQVLSHPLKPELHFVYPGSTQKMSFAERDEEKGFVEGELLNGRIETRFLPLPAYEMEMIEIEAAGISSEECEKAIRQQFWRCHEDLALRFHLVGGSKLSDYPEVNFHRLREEMPPVLECQFVAKMGKRWAVFR